MSEKLNFLPADLRAAAAKLPPEQQHTVLSLPPEGEGHNAGLIKVAAVCFKMGVSFEDTVAHLEEIYSAERIDHRTAPRRAATKIWEGSGELAPAAEGKDGAAPDIQEELLLRFRRTPVTELREKSPRPTNLKPRVIIKTLFEPDEIINIQQTRFEAGTLIKVSELADSEIEENLHAYKYLNPSVFKKVEGVPNPLDPDKKVSTRCNANVKARPFMLLEMDGKDEAAVERFTTFAITLASHAPLLLAVDTGNKSIHFWFDARQATDAQRKTIFNLACLHGADKALAVRSQIARMPNVSASDEGRGAQRVLYFDPKREATPEGGKWDVAGFEAFIQKARQLDYYYSGSTMKYFAQSNSNSWISLNRTSLTHQLARQGFRPVKVDGEMITPTDELISSIEMDKSIEEALKGASGRHAGYYEENGFRFLVLKSPTLIKPRKGDWNTIKSFLEHLLDHSPDQLDTFYGWISSSAKDLRNNGKRRAFFSPAQMLHLIGAANSGKTLLLKYILPYVLGGRSAEADALFDEKGASFNSDMFQSELLYLDDSDVLRTDHKFRQIFGERIKGICVGAGHGYHQKFGDKVPIQPWWRLVRMMNEEPHTLDTLPPLDDGVEDKLIYLRTRSMEGGKIDNTKAGWFEAVRDAMIAELPAFLQFLLEQYKIPDHIIDPSKRYAVASYKNPSLLDIMDENSSENYLVQKMDTEANNILFAPDEFADEPSPHATPWEGSANALYSILSECGSRNSQDRFKKTCPSPKVLAAQLRTLAKGSRRFIYSGASEDLTPKKKSGSFYWVIRPSNFIEPIKENEPEAGDCF